MPPEPEAEPTRITMTFAGDCTLGTEESFDYESSFTGVYDAQGPDYFFANVKSLFEQDDLTVVNCEGVLTDSTSREDKEYAYKGDPAYADIFARSSIEAASVSNNHIYDYGWNSRGDTINALTEAGVSAFGDEIVAYREAKGVKIALIGANMLSLGLGIQDSMTANIRAAQDAGAQIIVVFMHWGTMREYDPTDDQIKLAHAAVDAGATIVVGSHQHVLQGYETYNGRSIVYGLGNFCYGGSRTLGDPDCYIFQQTFTMGEDGVELDAAAEVIPCLISSDSERNNYQPAIAEGADKTRIEGKIAESSTGIAGRG
ncbi:CapA family protein [Raoultibacter phocaeensis]|uniref:CapA family protein n=1 Tax=Raoultibacter phocaeensis TaxID=2479841 RepID=UPI0015D624F0|nr:CapA family protein [Raoultibacter phocaeensis]